jgi:glycerophosphoryl diester phosphodiesterase
MRMARLGAALAAMLTMTFGSAAGQDRAALVLDRLQHANQWRDHVMVVAHRAGGLQGGKARFAENSLAAIEDAISAGAEMIEVDVRRSKDGTFIIMHDSWLDRTTTCKGEAAERSVLELKRCRLVIEAGRIETNEAVSTLSEVLAVTRGRILVNVDNKLGTDALPGIIAEAKALGMAEQVVVKENIWSDARITEVGAALKAAGRGFQFMPIIADDAVRDAAFVEKVARTFNSHAMELINWRNGAETLTETGGALFSTRMRATAVRGGWHLWANTYAILNKPGGFLAGGRGDELAVAAAMPAESWGFWAERGATIIQTDEPRAAIEWLAAKGYRVPYGERRPEVPTTTASIN